MPYRDVAAFSLDHEAFAMRIKPLVILIALGMPAWAHVNDRGVDYSRYKDHAGTPCCDERDCRPADDFIDLRERGQVRLLIDGQWIDIPRAAVVAEDARDGRAHWCGGRLFTNSQTT